MPSVTVQTSKDPLVLHAYSQDLWPRKLLELRENGPLANPTVDQVFWPETAQEVAQVIAWARDPENDAELYPYGAGSGVLGATIPTPDSQREGEPVGQKHRKRVVVDLKKMRKIRSLDRKSMTVWAEAGWIGENLERALNQEGFTLGHFPSSIYCSSLGGYLATRSAGQLSTKYGKIEDMVLAVEFVLPNGTIAETGRAPRSAMGPDWTQLLMGSEGTLGFFTAACLQIQPLPEARVFMGFAAASVPQALEFTRALMQRGTRPAVLRILDPSETSLTLSSEAKKACDFSGNVAIVAVFEGTRRIVEAEAEEVREIAGKLEVKDFGPALGEHWWAHRYDVSYKQQLILSHNRMILDTFEVAATWDLIEELYKNVKATSVGMGILLAHFSHFYHTGANIYFTLVSHAGPFESAVDRYDVIWENLLKSALASGATLSHHHGVGTLKNLWLRREMGAWIQVFEKVKRALDPENRFNPSKMGL